MSIILLFFLELEMFLAVDPRPLDLTASMVIW